MPAGAVIKLSAPATREFWELAVLHEDEQIIALAKPAGLLTSPAGDDPQAPSLMQLLQEGIAQGSPWATARQLSYLATCYRLDHGASGVLLLAKTKPAQAALANEFGSNKPLRTYAALSSGMPVQPEFTVDAKLGPQTRQLGVMRIDVQGGKQSVTHFKVREQFRGFTLLECRPVTDRLHQIRVHLRSLGLHVLGDAAYMGKALYLSQLKSSYQPKFKEPERPLMGRLALHLEQLEVAHPATGERLVITAEWPKDFRVTVKYLRQFSGL